ncbi:hypothetical protein BJH93_11685 [Kocuria polaris]|nr:hypothetical protein [Kocuria polaris]
MQTSRLPAPTRRRRLALAVAGLGVVPAGLASRFLFDGVIGDAAGGVLYAVLIYLLVAFVVPTWRPLRVGAIAAVLCFAVELFQLTPVPTSLAAVFPPIALVLGTTFVAADLPAYAAGAAAAAAVDALMIQSFTRRRAGRPGGLPAR